MNVCTWNAEGMSSSFSDSVLRLHLGYWACEGLTEVSVVASQLLCVWNESWDVGGGGRVDLQVRPLCFL